MSCAPAFQAKKLAVAVAMAATVTTTFSSPVAAQLEEVIVTAQKRLESAQDVPIAVTAFDADALQSKQINGFADIRFTAPNVTYSKGNFTGNNFQIRGIGTTLVAASSDSGVGIHVNEVPINSPRLFETEYFDVESIEVLRGPQGTLFGRNATGGTVNMVTARAEVGGELFGNIEGQYGEYDHTKAMGHINIPLGDTFAMRFAGLYLERDGYTDNLYTGDDVDGRDQYSVRGSLAWEPSEKTTIDLMVSYFEEDSNRSRSQKTMCLNDPSAVLGCLPDGLDFDVPNPSSQLSNILASNVALGPLGIFQLGSNERSENPNDLRKTISEFEPEYYTDETIVTLLVNHELENHTVSLVLGYQDTEVESQMDYQWTVGAPLELPAALPLIAPKTYSLLFADGQLPMSARSSTGTGSIGGHIKTRNNGLESYDNSYGTSEQYSIEARIASDYDGRFNWLAGGFYMDVDVTNGYYVFANGFDYLAAVVPALLGQDGSGWVAPQFLSDTDEYTIKSSALFGEVYYDLTETIKLTVGLRYTDDEKTIKDRQLLLNTDETGARFFQEINANQPIDVAYRDDDDDWQEFTGRGVVDWTLSDDSMIYASYSRGYKGGGFNPPFDPLLFPGTAKTFEPEFVDAFEIGTKNQFFNGTLQANGSMFFYDYQDLQVSKIINRTSFNENTDAEIFGIEAELLWAPTEGLLLNGNFAYLHTEVQDFESIDTRDPSAGNDQVTIVKDLRNASNCVAMIPPDVFAALAGSQLSDCAALSAAGIPITGGIAQDLSGNQLQNSPEYSLSLGGQYTFTLPQNHLLTARVDYYWQDDMYSRNFNQSVDKVEDWDIWNAQLTLLSGDETWYARAYVKNIKDDNNLVGMYVTDPSSGLYTNVFTIEPRTYGLALGYNF